MKNRFTPLLAGSLMSATLFCSAASQADTFLRIDDPKGVGEVKGAAAREGYEGQISVTSFSQSLAATEDGQSYVQFHLNWTSDPEPVNPRIYEALLNGRPIEKMVLSFVAPNSVDGRMVRRREIVLEEVTLRQHSESNYVGGTSTDFSVEPRKVTWTVWALDKSGTPVSPKSTTWTRPAADPD